MLGPNEGFAGFWEIVATADFIVTRGYRVVTLQFPDNLLKEATLVQAALARECQSKGGHRIEACLAPPPSLNVSCGGSDGEIVSTKCDAGLCYGRYHIQQRGRGRSGCPARGCTMCSKSLALSVSVPGSSV